MSRKKQSKQRASRKRANQAKSRNTKRKKEHLADAFRWLLPDESIFAKIKPHGNTKWLPRCLVFLALLCSTFAKILAKTDMALGPVCA